MKATCKHCNKEVDTTKFGKVAPHKSNNARCPGSGKRVNDNKEKNK